MGKKKHEITAKSEHTHTHTQQEGISEKTKQSKMLQQGTK